MDKTEKQLIISIGTGRSGSVSLSQFLSHQQKMRLLHEGKIEEKGIRTLIKWENDTDQLFKWITYLSNVNSDEYFYGDTGMYYLPYIKLIIQKYPNVKIIGLVRDKESVVNSYLNKTEGRNHWYNHNGKDWKKDEKWDPCYPKYNESNKKKALELYWEEYNETTKTLQTEFPEQIKMWTIREFNTENGKNEILDFIGYKLERDISSDYKLNQIKQKSFLEKLKKKWF
tara:strand:- start:1268 stop:1948 length:681 start_codon:yes stop_codon:yes gene_type:complete